MASRLFVRILFAVLFCTPSLFAMSKEEELLRQAIKGKISQDELKIAARFHGMDALTNALKAAQNSPREIKQLGISRSDMLKCAYFIEKKIDRYARKKKFHLSRKKTGLSHDVEFDSELGQAFIVAHGKRAYLGQGKSKQVTKAVLYNKAHPKVVARADQTEEMKREYEITKTMNGKAGVYRTVGFGKYDEHKVIYSKRYIPGSLQKAFEDKYKLSLHEKMKVAHDILTGLESLHSRKIVHRDLGARNYLINIPSGKPGKRKVEACIADLGRADYVKDASLVKIQGNTTYTCPEGLFLKKFKREDYYAADIFAVGCVFYRLFYEKMAPWQDFSYVKDTHRPLKKRYKEFVGRLNKATKARREKLEDKSAPKRSRKEAFELLILRMVHVDPKARTNAKSLRKRLERIQGSK